MNFRTKPAKVLQAVRQKLGLSQREFGEILGVSAQQISAIEKGRCAPSRTLLKLAVHEFSLKPQDLGLGLPETKTGLEEKSKKTLSYLMLAACVTAPTAPLLAGTIAAGAGAATIILRMCDAYGAKNESELAKKLDISRAAVSKWKKKGKVPPKYIIQAAQETGKTVEWFSETEEYQDNLKLLEKTVVFIEEEIKNTKQQIDIKMKAKIIAFLYGEFLKKGEVSQEMAQKIFNLFH